jgi:hypothetical protein
MYLKFLEKQELKSSRQKEIIKIRTDITAAETKRTIQKIHETKSWFFEKINKVGKTLAKLTKRKREKTQINKIKDKKGTFTANTNEI